MVIVVMMNDDYGDSSDYVDDDDQGLKPHLELDFHLNSGKSLLLCNST